MTTGIKIALGLAIAIAIGVGGFYGFSGKKLESVENNTPTETATGTPAGSTSGKKMAFGEFAKQGGTYACQVNQTVNGITTVGSIFMNNGNIRGDATFTSTAGPLNASFIIRDGFVYYWGSVVQQGQGIKLAYDISTYKYGDFSHFDQIGDYTCEEWTPDQSKFVVPTNINFQLVK